MMKRMVMLAAAVAVVLLARPAEAQLPGLQMGDQVQAEERSVEDVIRAQLRAFNAHDAQALVANLHEKFAWFAVDSDVTTLEMQGRGNFRDSMVDYFRTVPGVRADIEELSVVGAFASTVERAYWLQDGVEVSQASLAIYEIRNGLIYRVWYYPAFD